MTFERMRIFTGNGNPKLAEAVVRFRTARREEELAKLLAALISSGMEVAQFREVQTDLEEAFLTVARSEKEESALGARREMRATVPP